MSSEYIPAVGHVQNDPYIKNKMIAYGQRLKQGRIDKGLSQAKAAALIGRTGSWVGSLENWKSVHRPWPSLFFRYSLMMGIPVVDILIAMNDFDLFPFSDATEMHFRQVVNECLREDLRV